MAEPSKWPLGPRLAVAMGVPFGLSMALMAYGMLPEGLSSAWTVAILALIGLISGLGFGLSLALKATLFSSVSAAGADRASPRQERTLRLLGRPERMHAAVEAALMAQGVGQFTLSDAELGVIEGTSAMSFKSFGTQISVNVAAVADGYCKVQIRTAPRMPTQMIDYGAAAALVDAVEAACIDASEVPAVHEVEVSHASTRATARVAE